MKQIESLKALTYKPYRRIFIGSVISNVGTWVETVTIGIFMQTTTGNATYVAGAMAAGYVPQALMALFSGPIADRFSRKKILLITNTCAALIACMLTFAVATDRAKPAMVIFLIFLSGFLNAVAFPAWQAFLADIVPKDKIAGALSLMFAQWNLGRIIGPAIAAIFVSKGHYAEALGVNAVSFFFVVFMVSLVKENHYQVAKEERKFKSPTSKMETFFGGWSFILSKSSNMRIPFYVFCLVVFWASPFISLIPNVADEVFENKNLGTSLFTTFQGLGAVMVSVALTTLQIKFGRTRTQQLFIIALPFVMIGFGLAPNLTIATPIALLFGITYLGSLTSTTLTSQLAAPPQLKGRVSAAYVATLGLLFPLSSIIQSIFVERFGARTLFVSTGILMLILSIIVGTFSSSYQLPEPYEDVAKMGAEGDKHEN